MNYFDHHETVRHAGDAAAAFITVGTLVNILPNIAAIFTLVWTGMRIYEMFHGKGAISKWWKKRGRK